MGTHLAWLLNLDADDELADPSRTSSEVAVARSREMGAKTGLATAGDVVIDDNVRADGLAGRAWMPTPRALARIAAAGAISPPAPPRDVLTHVNDRAFSYSLGQTLTGAHFVRSLEEAEAVLALASPSGQWLLKRRFGFAGRGQRAVDASARDAEHPFLERAIRLQGGIAIEPLVERLGDFALHGHLGRDGELVLGEPTVQRCDAHGAWRSTERASATDLDAAEWTVLKIAARTAGRALTAAGYFGPFGVDAFRYKLAGREAFHPLSEINARYTMGWATGMGERRPDR